MEDQPSDEEAAKASDGGEEEEEAEEGSSEDGEEEDEEEDEESSEVRSERALRCIAGKGPMSWWRRRPPARSASHAERG